MPYSYESSIRASHNDSGFRRLVESLEEAMERLDLSPSDLRAAVVFASIRFERRRGSSLTLSAEEAERLGIKITPERRSKPE